jgi:hypothetical protein
MISQTEDLMTVILGNPVMIEAHGAGVPGNGKRFPDDQDCEVHWNPKRVRSAHFQVNRMGRIAFALMRNLAITDRGSEQASSQAIPIKQAGHN